MMEFLLGSINLATVYDLLKIPLGKEFERIINASSELEKLKRLRTVILNVQLDVANSSQQHALRDWLDEMKDAAYDAEDIIDMSNTEILRRESNNDSRLLIRWVYDFFSLANPLLFRHRIGSSVQKTLNRLASIAKEKEYHLTPTWGDGGVKNDRFVETIACYKDVVLGRDRDMDIVIDRLLKVKRNKEVLVLFGMAGVGKTTLARKVYSHAQVIALFGERKLWVDVLTKNFDLKKIVIDVIGQMQIKQKQKKINGDSKTIASIESSLQILNETLVEIFNVNKKFLLVLDNVWKDDNFNENWRHIESMFSNCKILVTAREKEITSRMSQSHLHKVECLSEDDCMSLFTKIVFGSGSTIPTQFESISKNIVEKCHRLPLAVRVLGMLMKNKKDVHDWTQVEERDIWEISDAKKEILPVLKLSYNLLPLHSRFCFAYCSIFPKGSVMNKMDLIQQWTDNGFISPNEANVIFKDLESRCFFQDVEKDDIRNITTFKMHDLIHDLAQLIAKYQCGILDNSNEVGFLSNRKNIRYLSIDMGKEASYSDISIILKDARMLRTLQSFSCQIINKAFLVDCFNKLKFLRVLNCSGANIENVPSSIENLKLLRYVDFSRTNIKKLPERICRLHNLQTLKLDFCYLLQVLPKELRKLSKLRHLENERCYNLNAMPVGMDQLSLLHTLKTFVVNDDGTNLNELRDLNLGGSLCLQNLKKTRYVVLENGILSRKKNLVSLSMSWGWKNYGNLDGEKDEQVLKSLQPHSHLKGLNIDYFEGSRWPAWLSAPSQLLVSVILSSCQKCDSLPSFGKLPYLRVLKILGLLKLEKIEETFYGTMSETIGFPSLEIFFLAHMPIFREWSIVQGREIFPKLNLLKIENCPKLEVMPQISTLRHLILIGCKNDLLSSLNLPSLTALEISDMSNLKCIRHNYFEDLMALKELTISYCMELVSFSDTAMKHLSSLQQLDISHCKMLKSLPNLNYLSSLQQMHILHCEKLESLPNSMDSLKSLQVLNISDCCKLKSLPNNMSCIQFLTTLKTIYIVECYGIRSWSDATISGICSVEENSVIEICSKDDVNLLSRWLRKKIDSTKILNALRINGRHGFQDYQNSNLLPGQHKLSICCYKQEHLPEELAEVQNLQHLEIKNCPNMSYLQDGLEEPGHRSGDFRLLSTGDTL